MATYTRTYDSNTSGTSIKSTHCITLTDKTDSINNICPNIPDYSIIDNVTIAFEWKTSLGSSKGDCSVDIERDNKDFFSTVSLGKQVGPLSQVDNDYTWLTLNKNSSIENTSARLPDYFNSGKSNVGQYSGSYTLCIWFSASVVRKFYWRNLTMKFDYTPPTYVLSLSASTGGTVSGGGTYEVGSTSTIKATPNTGYKFVKWSDGNTNAERQITITSSEISANVTNRSYTAYFEIDKTYVTYDSIFDFQRWANTNLKSWSLMNVSNVTNTGFTGQALVDDAYTEECRPLIPVTKGKTYTFECNTSGGGFEFFIFNCNSSGGWADFTYGNTNKFNFTPSMDYISIRCDVVGTGTVVNFDNFRIYPADCPYMGSTVSAIERTDINAWSMPTPTRDGYSFLGWFTQPNGGGVKYTSSSAFPSGGADLVLYSHWEIAKINKIYVGASQPKAIYIGTQEVKEVYIGTTKVYG